MLKGNHTMNLFPDRVIIIWGEVSNTWGDFVISSSPLYGFKVIFLMGGITEPPHPLRAGQLQPAVIGGTACLLYTSDAADE